MQPGELVLVWFLVQPEQGGRPSRLRAALLPLLTSHTSPATARALLQEQVERLLREGALEQDAGSSAHLSRSGRERALRALGLTRLPRGLTWRRVLAEHLPALALGIPADAAASLSRAEGLRGALVSRALKQPPRPLARARDAYLWQQLGVEADTPFTLEAVRTHLLNRALGTTQRTSRAALSLLAAREAGAPRADTRALRQALVTTLLAAPPPTPLADFATRALQAAAQSTTGRFGDDRVFISHAFQSLGVPGLSLEDFKARLLEANRARLLSLARADLVEAMDPADVAASATQGPARSTFHFLVLP